MRVQELVERMEKALGKQEAECYTCAGRLHGDCEHCPGFGTKRVLGWLLKGVKNG